MTPNLIRDISEAEAQALLNLIHRAFAGMEGRISPPSSLHHLTTTDLRSLPEIDAICVIGTPYIACALFRQRDAALSIEKLAVDPEHTRRGLGTLILKTATDFAALNGIGSLRVQTRIELTENHRFFTTSGFRETGRTTHPGFTRPTSITFEKPL